MNKVKDLKVYDAMLIVVDMVNGFVKEGDLADPKIGEVVPRQIELIKNAQEKENLVVFIKDTHTKESVENKRFGGMLHCIKGSGEEEVIDELKKYENSDNTISVVKNSTSFMESVPFRKIMNEASNIKDIDVIGCCTDICVVNGTIGLSNYLDEWNRDVNIRVHTDAVATFAEQERQNYVDASLLLMEQQGIQLVKKR